MPPFFSRTEWAKGHLNLLIFSLNIMVHEFFLWSSLKRPTSVFRTSQSNNLFHCFLLKRRPFNFFRTQWWVCHLDGCCLVTHSQAGKELDECHAICPCNGRVEMLRVMMPLCTCPYCGARSQQCSRHSTVFDVRSATHGPTLGPLYLPHRSLCSLPSPHTADLPWAWAPVCMALPVLYNLHRCPYCIRARMALAWAGCAYERREVLPPLPAPLVAASASFPAARESTFPRPLMPQKASWCSLRLSLVVAAGKMIGTTR